MNQVDNRVEFHNQKSVVTSYNKDKNRAIFAEAQMWIGGFGRGEKTREPKRFLF